MFLLLVHQCMLDGLVLNGMIIYNASALLADENFKLDHSGPDFLSMQMEVQTPMGPSSL